MASNLPKNSVLIRVDFSDLRHGLDILIASASQAHRKHVADMLVADVANLPPCTALSGFVGALNATLLFGDAPTPDIEQRFTDLVIAYAGYSASVLIAQQHQATAQAHGKRGGRIKGEISERDRYILEMFIMYRSHSISDREAVEKMVLAMAQDPMAERLSPETIRTIIKRCKKKTTH